MSCSRRNEIDAYVDGSLAEQQASEFEAHLRRCASCSAEAVARMQWKRAIRHAGRRYAPSAEFRQRVMESLAPHREPRRNWNWAVGWAASAAAIVLLILGLHSNRRAPAAESELSEATDLHVTTLANAAPLDVVSSDKHTVKPWFAGRLPFTFQLPALEGTGFVLLGGRVVYLAHSPGAQLLFQVRRHRISLFILQDERQASGNRQAVDGEEISSREQFIIDTWAADGLRYLLITDASRDDLRQLSGLLRTAASHGS